jgi:hypothetical protein
MLLRRRLDLRTASGSAVAPMTIALALVRCRNPECVVGRVKRAELESLRALAQALERAN